MVKRKEKLLILFLALVLFGGTLFFPVTGSAAGGRDGSIASSFAATVYGNYTATVNTESIPATPVAKAASASYTSIKLTWGAISGTTKYEVYRATSKTGKYSKITATTSVSYTNTGLTTGKTYYYKVRSYHLEGTDKVYGKYSAIVSAKPVPAAPKNVLATRASSSSIKITWGAVSGATKYKVYRATSSTGTYTFQATTTSKSYTNTGLTTGKTYYYKVRVYHLEGKAKVYGPYSAVVSAKPDTIVYITESGKKYHAGGCRYLSESKIKISLSDAKNKGYEPCSVCHPPS